MVRSFKGKRRAFNRVDGLGEHRDDRTAEIAEIGGRSDKDPIRWSRGGSGSAWRRVGSSRERRRRHVSVPDREALPRFASVSVKYSQF